MFNNPLWHDFAEAWQLKVATKVKVVKNMAIRDLELWGNLWWTCGLSSNHSGLVYASYIFFYDCLVEAYQLKQGSEPIMTSLT